MYTQDSLSLKGFYRFTLAEMADQAAWTLQEKIENARRELHVDYEKVKYLVDLLNGKYGYKPTEVMNIIPTVGRTALAMRLANNLTYTNVINKVALGSSATAVTNADTQLGGETYRNTVASLTNASNISYITGFFTAAETNGTYAEAGLFIDGTASANTGVLFSHVLASITKSSIQTLTIDWTLTIS